MVEIIRSFLNGLNLIIILWLLSVKPRHGYEIIKEFRRLTGVDMNPGAIYPLLHSLEKEGLTLSRWISDKEKNMSRRCYFLTVRGKRLFNRFRILFKERLRSFAESLLLDVDS
ncbi:PadR family transcriptional regulator [Candidatus Bathyarchaeota archaeon]|nr:MAG: PadR family transcriptional regulator [Candidatus Bathyarchaeota archaeon]